MPVYTLPTFNLLCDLYQPLLPPPVGPVTYAGVSCQLYVSSKYPGGSTPPKFLRMPMPAYQLWGPLGGVPGWYVNLPAGSGIWYEVQEAYVVHRGFANQYLQCTMLQIDAVALPAVVPFSIAP